MAEQTAPNSTPVDMSENIVATVVQHRADPPGTIFHFADHIIPSLVSGTHAGGNYHLSLQWHQLSKAFPVPQQSMMVEPTVAAFRMYPFSVQTEGVQTSLKPTSQDLTTCNS